MVSCIAMERPSAFDTSDEFLVFLLGNVWKLLALAKICEAAWTQKSSSICSHAWTNLRSFSTSAGTNTSLTRHQSLSVESCNPSIILLIPQILQLILDVIQVPVHRCHVWAGSDHEILMENSAKSTWWWHGITYHALVDAGYFVQAIWECHCRMSY